MKKKVLIDLKVVLEPPETVGIFSRTLEDKASHLDEWCRKVESLMLDHIQVSLSVERVYEEQCSYCGREWEVDYEGYPICCLSAQKEWENQNSH